MNSSGADGPFDAGALGIRVTETEIANALFGLRLRLRVLTDSGEGHGDPYGLLRAEADCGVAKVQALLDKMPSERREALREEISLEIGSVAGLLCTQLTDAARDIATQESWAKSLAGWEPDPRTIALFVALTLKTPTPPAGQEPAS